MPRHALLLLPLVIALGACKKDPPAVAASHVYTPEPPADKADAAVQLRRNFERVGFEYDSATLTASARRALDANAAILQAVPDLTVEVQGHCDERGTTEYNLALGEKRAQAVKRQLELGGVSAARIRIVSFGEERPLAGGQGESVWAQNRRAEFRIASGSAEGVSGTI